MADTHRVPMRRENRVRWQCGEPSLEAGGRAAHWWRYRSAVGAMAESIGLASGHPPAWFDTEDDGLGNWAGKVIGVSRSALCVSVQGESSRCSDGVIGERTGRPDRPLTRPVGNTRSRWPARQAARKACAGESASILIGGVATGRHGTAGNGAVRQLGVPRGLPKPATMPSQPVRCAPRQLGIYSVMYHGRQGCRGSSTGDPEPSRTIVPTGHCYLANASGVSIRNRLSRPSGCVHNIAHLGLPRQGAGSQGGRSEGCFGQCFAPPWSRSNPA